MHENIGMTMVEVEQQEPQAPQQTPKKRSILRGVIYSFVFHIFTIRISNIIKNTMHA